MPVSIAVNIDLELQIGHPFDDSMLSLYEV